jgi:7-cyano-7-deazaguanine synthase in queuosine biosynthesis
MAEMITKGKEKNRNKTVLLYSGGMDSLMIDYLLEPDVLLNISMNSAYDKRERESFPDKEILYLDDVINLGRYERDDAIVPNRNAHLVLLASHYGETIWLGSVSGDRSFDKDEIFYNHMETLLNHMWQEQHWTEERKFTVSSPFKDRTKTDLVEEYLIKGGSTQSLLHSYSCYEGEQQHCGHCKACFRKWVALENNGIVTDDQYWKEVPWDAPWLEEVLYQIYNGGYRGIEDKDIIDALDKTPRYLDLDRYTNNENG